MKILFFFLIDIGFFDTQNTSFLIVKGLKNAILTPLSWLSKWGAGLLQMMIQRDRPLADGHLEGPASCRWSYGGASLLQMVIRRGRPLANDDTEGLASCRWSSGGTGLLQMIIRRAATVRGVIGDSSGCMKIDFFLRKILFRTHRVII